MARLPLGTARKLSHLRGLLLLLLLLLIGCSEVVRSPQLIHFPLNKKGIHLLLDDGRQSWPIELWEEHIAAASAAVGPNGYVLQLVRADDLDIGRWQIFLDLCAKYQLRPMLRLATTFDIDAGYWERPPAGPQNDYRPIATQYAEFIAALEWPDDEHFIIVGNEPNHGEEWGGVADPAAYAHFFMAVAGAIRQVDTQAILLNAPLDQFTPNSNGVPFSNGFTYWDAPGFLDEMIAAEPELLGQLDGWASHSYPLGPFSRPPDEAVYQVDYLNGAVDEGAREIPAGLYNRGIAGYEYELYQLASYGVTDLPVYITETGWRHQETVNERASDNAPANLPTTAEAADYLAAAFSDNWLPDNRVYGVVPFALAGAPAEWGHTNWLLLAEDGSVLGSYEMFAVWAGLPPAGP